MCEDSVEKLSMDSVRKPLDVILPKLIALLGCNDEMVTHLPSTFTSLLSIVYHLSIGNKHLKCSKMLRSH